MKFNKVRYLPTGKGRGAVKLLVLFSLQALLLWTQKLFFMAIYLLSQMRYIFAACHASYAQKRYNLPCGRLRYDINPLHAPQGISHRRYIARDSVYRKSRKGFISLRSVLKGTTHTAVPLRNNESSRRQAFSLTSASALPSSLPRYRTPLRSLCQSNPEAEIRRDIRHQAREAFLNAQGTAPPSVRVYWFPGDPD